MIKMEGRFAIVAVLLLVQVVSGQDDAKVDYITPNDGGAEGYTRVMMHGRGFAVDMSLGRSDEPKKEVIFVNNVNKYDCHVHEEESDESQTVCYTSQMEPGYYYARIRLNGVWIDKSKYCNNRPTHRNCGIRISDWRTPLIHSINFTTGEPQQGIWLGGRLHTNLTTSSVAMATNGVTDTIARVWLTSGVCDLYESPDVLYGVTLSGDEGESRWGSLECRVESSYVGNQNLSFIVDGAYGQSRPYTSTKHVSADNRIYMLQTYAVVTDVSPKQGSVKGGTKLTITGNWFDNLSGFPTKVMVGGVECAVDEVTDTTITCVTSEQPPSRSEYAGGRGFKVEVFNGVTDLATDLSSLTPDNVYFSDSSHIGTYNADNFISRLRGFFVPPYDGSYVFKVYADDGAELYLNPSGAESADKEKIVVSDSYNTFKDSENYTLTGGNEYYIEVLHHDLGGNSGITMAVYTDTTNYTPAETDSAITDVQDITISSTVIEEKQSLTFQNWTTVDPVASQYRLTIACSADPCAGYSFTMTLFGVSTDPIEHGASAYSVQQAINSLVSLGGDWVLVAADETGYVINVTSTRGSMPLSAASSDASVLTVTLTETSAGEADLSTFTFEVNGFVSRPVAYDAAGSAVETAVEELFGSKCPPKLDATLGQNVHKFDTLESTGAVSGTRTSENSFCGLYSTRNPGNLFNDGDKPFKTSTYKTLCFAYMGDISNHLRISYSYKDSTTFESHSHNLQYFTNLDLPNSDVWTMRCFNLDEMLTAARPSGVSFEISRIYVTAGNDPDTDLYLDNILIASAVSSTSAEREELMRRIQPSAVPDIRISGVTVAKTAGSEHVHLKYDVTFNPIDCGHDFPLLGIAFAGKISGNAATATYGSNWPTAKVVVERDATASPPVEGSFGLAFTDGSHGALSGLDAGISAENLTTSLESLPGISQVGVERSGTCYGYTWNVKFISPGGHYSLMSTDGASLVGNSPGIIPSRVSMGGLLLDPAYGDFFRTAHDSPQVQVTINNVPSHCKGLYDDDTMTSCDFQYSNDATPTVTNVAPLSGAAGVTVTITGTGFSTATDAVKIGGVECVVSVNTETEIQCALGQSPGGQQSLTVNVNGKGFADITSGFETFTVSSSVTSITPGSGSIHGCTTVTISGAGFESTSTVTIGSSACDVTSASYNEIICVTSSHAAGSSEAVSVTTSGEASTSSVTYEYTSTGVASVMGISETTSTAAGGSNITLTGSGLGTTTGMVLVGTKEATVHSWTDTEIVFTAPSLPAAVYDVSVIIEPLGCASVTGSITYAFSVTSINPASGSLMGGTTVSVAGSGFTDDVNIMFGDVSCEVQTPTTPTSLTCVTSPASKKHDVTNSGNHPTYGIGYAWSPSTLEVTLGDEVRFSWSVPEQVDGVAIGLFTIADAVSKSYDEDGFKIDPVVSGSFTYRFTRLGTYHFGSGCADDANTCAIFMRGAVTVVAATTQTNDMTTTLGDQTAEGATQSFTFDASATPTVTSISPNKGTTDDEITIAGTGFSAAPTVMIGDKECAIASASGTNIVCQMATSEELPVGSYHSVAVNINGVGAARTEVRSLVGRNFLLQPLMTSSSPASGSTAGGTKITIQGSGFDSSAEVTVAGISCEVSADETTYTQLVCTTPANPGATGGVVVTQNQMLANCSSCTFQFDDAATPSVTSRADVVSGDLSTTDMTFAGTKFGTDPSLVTVTVGTESCAVSSVTDTEVLCQVARYPAGSNQVVVKVAGKGLASFDNNADSSVTNTAQIDSVSPTTGSVNGGTVLTIDGNGFVDGDTTVTVGGIACDVTSTTFAQIVCTSGAHSEESVDLEVTSNNVAYTAAAFEYSAAATPDISSIAPVTGVSGDSITLTGTGFGTTQGDVTVTVGGVACVVTSVIDTSASCTLGAREGGAAATEVHVSGKGLSAVSNDFSYTLTVSSATPVTGSYGGSQQVVISGQGFSDTSVVKLCDQVCTDMTGVSATSITCMTPSNENVADGTTSCDVSVSNGDTSVAASGGFTFDSALTPVITSVSPRRGGTGGGTRVTISGTGLEPGSGSAIVTIDGSVCDVVSASATEIVCDTNSHQGTVKAKVKVEVGTNGIATQDNADFEYIDRWSSIFTWGGTTVPTTQDFVIIQKGQTVLLDTDTAVLKMLLIDGGELIFDNENDVSLSSENILITNGGLLQIGTEESPHTAKAEIVMYGNLRSPELPIYGAKTLGVRNGTLDLHGRPILHTWTLLASTAAAGDTQLTLQQSVDWQVDDLIIIASTGLRHSQEQNELRMITAVSADGFTLTLNESLAFEHLGISETYGTKTVQFRAEVGLLTRNIKFRGSNDPAWHEVIERCEDGFNTGMFATQTCFQGRFGEEIGADQFGASIMVHSAAPDSEEALARIEHIEVTYAGQAFRLGRYPIHFHLMGNVSGMYVRGCAIHQTFNRAVTIHGTHNLLVERNVVYNIMGGAIFIEDGIETQNVIQYNLAVFVKQSTSLLNDDVTPAAYWVTNPDNILRHNHAAGGTHFGFWYRMHEHPDGPSFTPHICQRNVELGEFSNNTVHSQGWFGLWIFQKYTPMVDGKCGSSDPSPARFRSLTTWNCEKGAEWVECGAIQFHDFVMVNNEDSGMDIKLVLGTPWGQEKGAVIHNSIIVGHSNFADSNYESGRGIVLPFAPGLTVSDTQFFNFNRRGAAMGVTSITGTCTTQCGGFYYWVSGLSFTDVTQRVVWRYEHEGVIEDRDGSLLGGPAFSKLVPHSGLLDPTACPVSTGELYSSGQPSAICTPATRFHRFAVNNVIPTSLEGNDIIFCNDFGNTSLQYRKKRLTHKPGWMGLLTDGYEHCYKFRDGEQFTNITYNARFYDFAPDDFIIVTHEFKQNPDRIFINDQSRYEIENSPVVSVAEMDSLQNLDWNFDPATQNFKYVVAGTGYPKTSRKRRASLEVKDPNFSHTSVSIDAYRCFYEDCITPPDASQIPPNRNRPEVFHLWSEASNPCVNRTDPQNIIVLPRDGDVDCWVVFDVTELTVDVLTINGVLEFPGTTDSATVVSAINIVVNGRLIVGFTEANPFINDITFSMRGDHDTPDVALPGVTLGSKAIGCFGGCDFHGLGPNVYWTHLASTANIGTSTIVLQDEVDWVVGNEIVITTTGYASIETEKHVIAAIGVDKVTLTLSSPLAYRHLGETYTAGSYSYDMRAEVGLLTRNVKIVGEAYDLMDKQAFGARVLVGTYSVGDETLSGFGRFTNVEFHQTGQEGWTEEWDPRFSLAWLNTGLVTPAKPSFVSKCAFHDGFSTAIGMFGATGINVTDNVVHRTVHDGIRVTGSNHRLERNLVTVALFRGSYGDRYEPTNFKDWQANFEISQASNLVMINNTAAGGERLCFHLDGEACDATDEKAYFGNVAHGCLHAIHIFLEDGVGDCSLIRNFVVYKAWDYGIYHQTQTSVVLRNVIVVDSTVGYLPIIFAPAALSHAYVDKHASIEGMLCVGRSPSFDPSLDTMDESTDKNLRNRNEGPSRISFHTPTGGSTCIALPQFASGSNGAPFKPFHGNKAYPALHGLLNITGLTAQNYGIHDGKRDLVFFTNPKVEDIFHPTYVRSSSLINVDQASMAHYARPGLDKINPSDCVDMECDAKKKVLIKDIDGTLLGEPGAIVPEAEFGWDDPALKVRGLGDYRIPTTLKTAVDGSLLPVSDFADLRGIARNNNCTYIAAWQAYSCSGPGAYDYHMLVLESLDSDTETRRLSPVALLSERCIDLNNGPQDHGWCAGYTCQKRISVFYMIVPAFQDVKIFLSGSDPDKIKLHLLNVDDSVTLRVGIYYQKPERRDVYKTMPSPAEPLYIHPTNSFYDANNEFWTTRKPSGNDQDEYKPAINSPLNGANYFDTATRILYVTMRGPQPIEIVRVAMVFLEFGLPSVSVDEFFGEKLITNLAAFLDIPSYKIRVVDVVRETSTSRRRRDLGYRNRRATEITYVKVEFGDEVTNTTSLNTTGLTSTQLNNLTDQVLLQYQEGNLYKIVNTSVLSFATEASTTDTSENVTNTLIVHKVPSKISVTISNPVEEYTLFQNSPTISLLDDTDAVVTTLGGSWQITVSLDTTAPTADNNAELIGSTTATISNGTAVFSDLRISHSGQGYVLRFTVSQPAGVIIAPHDITINVNQRVVQAAVITGIGQMLNHNDDVIMTLQLQDSFGRALENLGYKGHTWTVTASLDDPTIYSPAVISGTTSFTFTTNTPTIQTTGLKISGTQRYHKYNIRFTIQTTPALYDITLTTDPVQFKSLSDVIHSTTSVSKRATLEFAGQPYTDENLPAFNNMVYNSLIDTLSDVFIGSLRVVTSSTRKRSTSNTQMEVVMNAGSEAALTSAVESLKTYLTGNHGLTFNGNALTLTDSECKINIDGVCQYTTTTTVTTTTLANATMTTTTQEAAGEDNTTWIIIGVALCVSVLLAGGAIALSCYLKKNKYSKVGPTNCMGGSTSTFGSTLMADSIPGASANPTPSPDSGTPKNPRMTPIQV